MNKKLFNRLLAKCGFLYELIDQGTFNDSYLALGPLTNIELIEEAIERIQEVVRHEDKRKVSESSYFCRMDSLIASLHNGKFWGRTKLCGLLGPFLVPVAAYGDIAHLSTSFNLKNCQKLLACVRYIEVLAATRTLNFFYAAALKDDSMPIPRLPYNVRFTILGFMVGADEYELSETTHRFILLTIPNNTINASRSPNMSCLFEDPGQPAGNSAASKSSADSCQVLQAQQADDAASSGP